MALGYVALIKLSENLFDKQVILIFFFVRKYLFADTKSFHRNVLFKQNLLRKPFLGSGLNCWSSVKERSRESPVVNTQIAMEELRASPGASPKWYFILGLSNEMWLPQLSRKLLFWDMVISPIVLWHTEKIYEVLEPLWNLRKPSSAQLYFWACKFQNTKSKLIDWSGNIFHTSFFMQTEEKSKSCVLLLRTTIKDYHIYEV